MDKITWLLGADASQVRTEMLRTTASVKSSVTEMVNMFRTVDASHGKVISKQERLLESNNRVTNQVAGFTRTLLNASSATDVLAGGLDRLENSTNLSLAGGIMLAGGAVLIDQLGKFQKAYAELEREMTKLSKHRPDAMFSSMAGIQAHLEKIISLRERLETIQNKSPYSRIGQDIAGGAGSPFGGILGALAVDANRKAEIAKLAGMEENSKAGMTGKREQQFGIDKALSAGQITPLEAEATKLVIAFREANTAVRDMNVATQELNLSLHALTKARNDKAMERSGMTLAEAANLPDVVDNSVSFERYKASQDAKRALALKDQGEAARIAGSPENAHNLFNQAGELTEGMTGLKPSEKMSVDFKGALSVAEDYLKKIAESKAVLVNK